MAAQPVLRMFGLRSRSRSPADEKKDPPAEPAAEKHDAPTEPSSEPHPDGSHDTTPVTRADPAADSTPSAEPAPASASMPPADTANGQLSDAKRPTENVQRRFSWLPLGKSSNGDSKPAAKDQDKKPKAAQPSVRPAPLVRTRSEKQAQQSALLLRELIVGPSSSAPSKVKSKASSSAEVDKVKAQLARPKSANKVIAQLRQLSSSDEPVVVGTGPNGETLTALPKGPIHAVCLPYTDAEAHDRHFSRLTKDKAAATPAAAQSVHATGATTTVHSVHVQSTTTSTEIASVANASITTLKTVFSEINLVSLITTPDLGLGGPPDGPGILSGALPTASAIIDGVQQITPQLMALGYATGKAVMPDHAGVYPPTDRMSVITYWWGLEVVLPQPSLQYLQNVPSITHAVINFLTALSLVEGGVREIMPFIRYISSFIDTEFSMIQEQDMGQGVVCAATWIMPAALVPRPWDFPQPPPKSSSASTAPAEGDKGTADSASQTAPPASAPTAALPAPTSAPMFVVASDKTVPAPDVPKVEVTPPTPHVSQTLNAGSGEAEGNSSPAPAPALAT